MFVEERRVGGRGRGGGLVGSLKSKQKRTGGGGGGPIMCVRSFLKRECIDFQNEVLQLLSSFSYFPIDYNDSMKY